MKAIQYVFMLSIVAYAAVGWLVAGESRPSLDAPTAKRLAVILGLVWIATLGIIPILGRSLKPPRTAFLVRLAIFELGAIFGLVLAFLAGDKNYALGFGICSLMLMAASGPEDVEA